MAPKKKANGAQKNGRIKPRYRQHRKRPNISRRLCIYKPSVREIVYALMNKHNQERKRSRAVRDDRYRGKMRKYRNTRESSCDSSFCDDNSSEGSEYTKSVATSVENLSSVMDVANNSETSSTEDSSASNISVRPIALAKAINNTRALLKKKSLVQVINNYIKAGIEEGKRQAKKYLRKALSFGVKSGYLIPTDSEGQVIRVAPTLMDTKRSNAESRKRRRRARRGEDDPLIGSKDRCPTPPWKIKKREDTPKSQENPLQKRGKSSSLKKSPIRRKKFEKRSSRQSRRKMTRRKINLLIDNFCNGKSEENLKSRKRRRSLSRHDENRRNQRKRSKSVCTKERNENSRKNNRSFSDNEDISIINSHEVNERMSMGRLKSISKENASRNCNVPSENPVEEEIEEKMESLNEERNENDMI